MSIFTKRDNNNFLDNIIDTDNILGLAVEWIQDVFNPEDIFGHDALEYWAMNHGFTRLENKTA